MFRRIIESHLSARKTVKMALDPVRTVIHNYRSLKLPKNDNSTRLNTHGAKVNVE
jgi:hypothetical protein